MKKVIKILTITLISIGFLAACDAGTDNPDLYDPAVEDPAMDDGIDDNLNNDTEEGDF
ncbi:hypothetical protein [Amphibacillus xylanus]|uniref:Lipoprotein n=1 Tax=Amphibacillus xylanus (strain ATCC 51415 / DSM 6626 / JCM 7361 / LMG 17667 / NBRC 15112 / Ep01) TaxID=698758 RepID=K0J594_AMPXN|nr:hypothetical protein [Amphibacillus xylanus]BAM48076.1 hypothetical protein AXY_19440 [Amphibacillus xylanus NBRC 15112]